VVVLEASARVLLDDAKESLEAQLDRALAALAELSQFSPSRPADDTVFDDDLVESDGPLLLSNGIGRFTADGREYVIHIERSAGAAWAWRLAVEEILGLRRVEGRLLIDPCLPPGWGGYEAMLRSPRGAIRLRVCDPEGLRRGRAEPRVEGSTVDGAKVDFPPDGSIGNVEAHLVR
jgi:hypothetical protein